MELTIGDVVRRLRRRNRLTQAQLALKAGTSAANISLIEAQGNDNPSCRNLAGLARALRVTPQYILEQSGIWQGDASERAPLPPSVQCLIDIIERLPPQDREVVEESIHSYAEALLHLLAQPPPEGETRSAPSDPPPHPRGGPADH